MIKVFDGEGVFIGYFSKGQFLKDPTGLIKEIQAFQAEMFNSIDYYDKQIIRLTELKNRLDAKSGSV